MSERFISTTVLYSHASNLTKTYRLFWDDRHYSYALGSLGLLGDYLVKYLSELW